MGSTYLGIQIKLNRAREISHRISIFYNAQEYQLPGASGTIASPSEVCQGDIVETGWVTKHG